MYSIFRNNSFILPIIPRVFQFSPKRRLGTSQAPFASVALVRFGPGTISGSSLLLALPLAREFSSFSLSHEINNISKFQCDLDRAPAIIDVAFFGNLLSVILSYKCCFYIHASSCSLHVLHLNNIALISRPLLHLTEKEWDSSLKKTYIK